MVGCVRVLPDGQRVLVRPVVPTDRDELAAGYEQLSPGSRRARFGVAPDHLSDRQLDELLDLDDDHVALAAFAIDEPGTPGVAVARFRRGRADPAEAEAAVVVLDDYQHRGIGSVLLLELVGAARARGIEVFTATVAWENRDLLDALQARGASVEPAEPGVAAIRVRLADVERSAA